MSTSMEAASAATGRGLVRRIAQMVLWALLPAGAVMAQTLPLQETTTLSSDTNPIESDFSIPQSGAGQYKITLTDLGALLPAPPAGPGPAPLDNAHVVITRGTTVVATVDTDADTGGGSGGGSGGGGASAPVTSWTATFDATPGTYKAHLAGKAGTGAGSGPVGLTIKSVASNASVLDLSGAFTPLQTAR